MSEINGDTARGRRRAVRSAGPPQEEETAAVTPAAGDPAPVGKSGGKPAAPAAESEPTTENRGEAAQPRADGAAETEAEAAADGTAAPGGNATAGGSAAGGDSAAGGGKKAAGGGKKAAGGGVAAAATADVAAAAKPVDLAKDDPTDAPETTEPAAPSWKRYLLTAAAAIVAIAIVTAAVLTTLGVRADEARDDRRAEYVQTARQAILNLTTIRADSAKEDIDRILAVASGDFKNEFDGRVDPFTDIVQQAKVVSTGEIVETAVESDDENGGRILVAAKQTLTNAGQAEPQTRYYRFRVTVSRGDDGLTASKVEFVA